jgi:hypothetical protein
LLLRLPETPAKPLQGTRHMRRLPPALALLLTLAALAAIAFAGLFLLFYFFGFA